MKGKSYLPIGIDPKAMRKELQDKRMMKKHGYTKEEVVKFYKKNKKENGMTQQECAKHFGIHINTMHYYLQSSGATKKCAKHNENDGKVYVRLFLTKELWRKLKRTKKSPSVYITQILNAHFKTEEQ